MDPSVDLPALLPDALHTRPLSPADRVAAYGVYAADQQSNLGELFLEQEDVEAAWSVPGFDPARHTVGVFAGLDLVGVAEVSISGHRAEVAVLPHHWGQRIGSWLAQWAQERARELGAPALSQMVPAQSSAAHFLQARGYTESYRAWGLTLPAGVSIPARALPTGYQFITGDTAEGARTAHRIVERAFGEWNGRDPESFETWATATVARPGAQSWQLRLVLDPSGSAVATAFTILDSVGTAFVHQLAVAKEHRGQGIAQALLVDAFARGAERGATRSELATDSRTGALDLYRKVGMEVTTTWANLALPL